MRWYADLPAVRTRQLLGDGLVAGWVVLWLWLALRVHGAVERLAAPGRELTRAGEGLRDGLGDAARGAGRVPGVGGGLRAPLDAAAGAGDALVRAGTAQQAAVGTLALVLGLLVGLLPVVWALGRWLPGRLAWAREAGAAGRLRADVELLALRAAASAPLPELARLGPDPVTRWRAGDAEATQALAALELRRLGLRASPRP